MGQRITHMYDQTPTGRGTITSMVDGQAIVMVEFDMRKGKSHPCLRQELIFLDQNDQIRPKRVPFKDRDDRDNRGGRGRDRDSSFVASA